MASKTTDLIQKGLLKHAPKFLQTAVHYEVVMGSVAYGVASDDSDMDIYGFAIPPRDHVFPHLNGYIHGFDEAPNSFEQLQQHHIVDKQALGGKGREYDITVYSITKYVRLLMACNPNIIDSLFVPRNCILYSTQIGEHLRENRRLFLHKGCWSTFKGYAYSQMHKMATKEPEGKRKAIIEEFGYDVKFAYHVVRLLNEVEQILLHGELELAANREQLKAIRRGEWTQQQVENYFQDKEILLEKAYVESSLPAKPNYAAIKKLLLECLEAHYGNLDECVRNPGLHENILVEIRALLNKAGL